VIAVLGLSMLVVCAPLGALALLEISDQLVEVRHALYVDRPLPRCLVLAQPVPLHEVFELTVELPRREEFLNNVELLLRVRVEHERRRFGNGARFELHRVAGAVLESVYIKDRVELPHGGRQVEAACIFVDLVLNPKRANVSWDEFGPLRGLVRRAAVLEGQVARSQVDNVANFKDDVGPVLVVVALLALLALLGFL